MMARPAISGFSLIELLVVIFVLGLLAAILLPALSASRAAARSAKCASRLHSLIQADFQYAQDNNGILAPRPRDPAMLVSFAPSNYATWQGHLAPYLGMGASLVNCTETLTGLYGQIGPEVHYVDLPHEMCFDRKLVINCPAAEPVPCVTYALNFFMAPFGSDYGADPSPWAYRLAVVPKPSEILIIGDVVVIDSPAWGSTDTVLPSDEPASPSMPPAARPIAGFRHGPQSNDGAGHPRGVANFAFADGHVGPLHYSETLKDSGHWKWW